MRRLPFILSLRGDLDEVRRRQVPTQVALELGVPLAEARAFLAALPLVWPKNDEIEVLNELGLCAEPGDATEQGPCAAHEQLRATRHCTQCDAGCCTVCVASTGEALTCPACAIRKRRRRGFFYVRVAILLSILGVVLLYAWNRHRRLERRTTWAAPLEVAIVVVPRGPIDGDVLTELRQRESALQQRLHTEYRRYATHGVQPFRITVYAAPGTPPAPPAVPDDVDTLSGLARYTWHKRNWVKSIDDAVGLPSEGFDACIYLVARPIADGLPRTVEGVGEDGGTIGIVEIDLSDDTVDLALFVAAHELFHLLGADDRYGPTGDVQVPGGLAEPDLQPLYPQRFTELMARQRPVSETNQVLPESLDELRVGATTAGEVGWTAH